MSEQNKAIIRRSFEELFNDGKLEVADEVFARDYVGHDPALPKDLRGPGEFKQFVRMYRGAFPDIHITVDEQIAEGDMVVTRFTARGTHRGELFGIAPTGRQITVTGISIDHLAGGKSVESWTNYDVFTMLQQLGAMPAQRRSRPSVSDKRSSVS